MTGIVMGSFDVARSIAAADDGAATHNDGEAIKMFDLAITGGVVGDTPASAGLVLVDKGNVGKAEDFVVPQPGGAATQSGTYVAPPISTPIANTVNYRPAGMAFFGVFTDTTKNLTATTLAPDVDPFAFTPFPRVGFDRGPLVTCRSVVSTITSTTAGNAGVAAPATKLTGGQTSTCYLASRATQFTSRNATEWLNEANDADTDADPNTNWKRAFYIAVAGIRTDGKELKDVLKSFTGANDQAKVAAFMDGLTAAEMKLIADNNIKAYKKILLKIVPAAEFAAAP